MLQIQSVSHELLEVLKQLQSNPIFSNFRLVGGTSLALQWGHRVSVDIDLFANEFLESDEIISELNGFKNLKI